MNVTNVTSRAACLVNRFLRKSQVNLCIRRSGFFLSRVVRLVHMEIGLAEGGVRGLGCSVAAFLDSG